MTKKEFNFYVDADSIMAGKDSISYKNRIKQIFMPDHIAKFMLLLRKVEYWGSKQGKLYRVFFLIARYRFSKISLELGFSIPPNVFGPGLYIPHYGTIVINRNVKVGANCVLHTSTCIAGPEQKVIGDNIYISFGTVITGNIKLANNITISANSFVNQSFLEDNVLIGGSPARLLKQRKAWFDCDDAIFSDRAKRVSERYNAIFG